MKEDTMSPHTSDHWLVFVAEPLDDLPVELIAIPARTEQHALDRAPRAVLAASDAYRDAHPDHGVVFLASVTRWLTKRHDLTWCDLSVDLDEALTDLRQTATAVTLDASPLAAVIVATGGNGNDPSIAAHLEPVRAAIAEVLRNQGATIR
jgi:hypothetical protein